MREGRVTCSQCRGIGLQFDATTARRDLKRYRRRGPAGTTRKLIRMLAADGVAGRTFLDVGGGVGAIQHELIGAGASGGTHADASPAYLAASRTEAERRGHADRVRFVGGDFLDVHHELQPADIVTLDRVVCCYPDMPGLIDASASHARRSLGLVYPRDRPWVRALFGLANLIQRVRRHPFRAFVHRTEDVERRIEAHGLRKRAYARGLLWQVVVFGRPDAEA
jgi:2-polyprenyl-3-methyl-5-hydroxy-6-metoxy-1,4-benzoquinol methylase